jgi:ribosomal protein L13
MKNTQQHVVDANGKVLGKVHINAHKQASMLLGKSAKAGFRIVNGIKQLCWVA